MSMKNEDLKLAAKAVEVNRQDFEEALAVHNALSLAKKLREEVGIPIEGFTDQQGYNDWMYSDPFIVNKSQRNWRLKNATASLLKTLALTENFMPAVRHFLLYSGIGHIPGNFSVSFSPGSKDVLQSEHGRQLMTGEKRLVEKLKGTIHEALGNKQKRTRKNAERDLRIVQLSKNKGKEERDEVIAAQLTESDENADISTAADRKRVQVIKKVRERTKKRH